MNYFIHLEGGECRLSLNLNSYMFMLEHRFKQLIKDKGLKTTFLAKKGWSFTTIAVFVFIR